MKKGFESFDTAVVDVVLPTIMLASVLVGLADGTGFDNFAFDTEWEGAATAAQLALFFSFLGWLGANVADDWRGYD